jgi:hypothetical protein
MFQLNQKVAVKLALFCVCSLLCSLKTICSRTIRQELLKIYYLPRPYYAGFFKGEMHIELTPDGPTASALSPHLPEQYFKLTSLK